jgi:hypothetical protein
MKNQKKNSPIPIKNSISKKPKSSAQPEPQSKEIFASPPDDNNEILGQNLNNDLIPGEDYYFNEAGLLVMTKEYHLKRGSCCESGCLHCPYGFKGLVKK